MNTGYNVMKPKIFIVKIKIEICQNHILSINWHKKKHCRL